MSENEYSFETRFHMETEGAVFSVGIGTGERTKGFVRVSIMELDEFGEPSDSTSFVLDEGEFLHFRDGVGQVAS